jgi:hypothetical protein
MISLTATINGVPYRVKVSDFSDTTGPQDPGINNRWTVYRNDTDTIGYGVLLDLGKKFGYRLVLKGDRGLQTSQEFTRDQVTFEERA